MINRLIKITSNQYFAYALVFLGFTISRGPYFISAPIPGFTFDTFEYLNYIIDFNQGKLPRFNFVPPGFTTAYYLIHIFTQSTFAFLVFQSLISLGSCLFLVRTVKSISPKLVAFSGCAAFVILMDSAKLRYDTMLHSESLYFNGLLIVSLLLIQVLWVKNYKYLIPFSIIICLPAFIRPQGIYLYGFYAVIVGYLLWFIKMPKRQVLLKLILPFIIFNMLWASYNKVSHGTFMFGAVSRYAKMIGYNPGHNHSKEVIPEIDYSRVVVKKYRSAGDNLFQIMTTYFNFISKSPFDFYERHIADRYDKLYMNDGKVFPLLRFNGYVSTPYDSNGNAFIRQDLMSLTFQENYKNLGNRYFYSSFEVDGDESKYKPLGLSKILYQAFARWQPLYQIFVRNKVTLVFYWISLLYFLFWLIKSRVKDNEALAGILTAGMLFISFLIISLSSGVYYPRYLIDSEFVYLLLPILAASHFIKKIGKNNVE